jgi:uncharacterized BrkB/YihY/UPF0761 family membrane protein
LRRSCAARTWPNSAVSRPRSCSGLLRKFGDDNGGVLVTNLAYAAFVSVFPLLLILVTVLVTVAAGDPGLRDQVINGATNQFPLVGRQLASNIHGLKQSTVTSLISGLLVLVWVSPGSPRPSCSP